VDWREDAKLNEAIDKIICAMDGSASVFEIAENVGLSYQKVYDWLERCRAKGLVGK